MKKIAAIFWAMILAGISVFLFVFVLPTGGPALPGTSILEKHQESKQPKQPETPDKQAPIIIEQNDFGSHPMDKIIETMTLEEQVAQMFWVRCPQQGVLDFIDKYAPAGLVLFGQDFENKSKEDITQAIYAYQEASDIPLLIGTDEEGGTVVRASAQRQLRRWPFESPQEVYAQDGLAMVEQDTAEKDQFLKKLGINVNLAPVADVSTNRKDFIYPRTLGKGAAETADYVSMVVRTMKRDGMGSVLKHFPGYGPNGDTHTGPVTDTRPAEAFHNGDFLPFRAGIQQGADAILVSHNIIQVFDAAQPASLSPNIHQILREDLGFQGVIVTDDLAMKAITDTPKEAAVRAVQAGNDLLISSSFETQYRAVLDAVQEGTISKSTIHRAVRHVLQWKKDLGLLQNV